MVTRIVAYANAEDTHASEVQEMCQYVTATSFMCMYALCTSYFFLTEREYAPIASVETVGTFVYCLCL